MGVKLPAAGAAMSHGRLWMALLALAVLGGAFAFRSEPKMSLGLLTYEGTGTNRCAIFAFTNGTSRNLQVLLADPVRSGGAVTAWYLLQMKTQGGWTNVWDAGRPAGKVEVAPAHVIIARVPVGEEKVERRISVYWGRELEQVQPWVEKLRSLLFRLPQAFWPTRLRELQSMEF